MTRFVTILALVLATGTLSACPDDDDTSTDTGVDTSDYTGADTGMDTGTPDVPDDADPDVPDDTGPDVEADTEADVPEDVDPDVSDVVEPQWPAAPALGTQIDRMGRPGITTALIGTFDGDAAAAGALKDSYNVAAAADWGSFLPEIAANLAIYDSLDTVCGNQLLAAAPPAAADTYLGLAGALADDQLYVNTTGPTCTTYLAVEANATGVVPNDDCGGRALGFDVMDVTYSVLAIGALAGVGDDIDADDGTPSADFPFLDAPGEPVIPTPDPPALGAAIDRMGRPAISTALVGTFSGDAAVSGPMKDAYNVAAAADWADYLAEIAANLAIYDSLDTLCGNQLLAGDPGTATTYSTLAGALADDQLYVNTSSTSCGQYLAVEADATGILANADCGGRGLAYDVIDTTYSALAAGILAGVGDGIDADDGTFSATFPYLDVPGN